MGMKMPSKILMTTFFVVLDSPKTKKRVLQRILWEQLHAYAHKHGGRRRRPYDDEEEDDQLNDLLFLQS